MKYETINQAIAAVMGGKTTATQAAADIHPQMSYAVKYYSPAEGEWSAYQAIVLEYKKLESPAPIVTQAPAPVEMKKCSCGHTIPKHLVMSASMGSSCPSCYDRMSE